MTNAKCILFTWQSMEINKDKDIDENVISATRTADVVEKTDKYSDKQHVTS